MKDRTLTKHKLVKALDSKIGICALKVLDAVDFGGLFTDGIVYGLMESTHVPCEVFRVTSLDVAFTKDAKNVDSDFRIAMRKALESYGKDERESLQDAGYMFNAGLIESEEGVEWNRIQGTT